MITLLNDDRGRPYAVHCETCGRSIGTGEEALGQTTIAAFALVHQWCGQCSLFDEELPH